MSIYLFEHNRQAYEAAVTMLEKTGKAAVIHPTGTGKSFIGFKLCEDNPDKTILWLSPSEYIFKTQLENLAVVSEGYQPENIKFFTYAKLMNMAAEEISEIKPDYIILDEFHRCGAEMWGMGVQRLLGIFKKAPVLGFSATAVRYLDNQRDMADELFEGNIASEMTLGESIVRGILNLPKYILSMYSYSKDLEKYEKRVKSAKNKAVRDTATAYLEALKRALSNAEGLDVIFDKHMTDRHGKYIIFTPNYDTMQDYMELSKDWFSRVDEAPHIYSVYSDDPSASKSFRDFKEDDSEHLKLLYCIDALNEGVHVEDVSGVILMRPTVSPIIYKQQIGRALSASKSREPVIFDIVNNIENLYSIDSVKEEIRAAITYYHYTGQNSMIVNDSFSVLDEAADCRQLFDALENSLTASWELMYEKARAYYEANGDLMIPAKYITDDGCALGNWLSAQRKAYAGKTDKPLTQVQISKLEAIGIVWTNHLDYIWETYFDAAKDYFKEHGDLKVPNDYVTDSGIKLGIWIQRMRSAKSKEQYSVLTPEKESRLNSIGMVWNVISTQWEENYLVAVKYFNSHGNLDIPSNYIAENGIKLGNWIVHLRQKRLGKSKGSPLSNEQILRLNKIGMIWDTDQYRFDVGLAHAQKYYEQHKHLRVPVSYICDDDFELGKWIRLKRRQYKAGNLSAENIHRLEKIGMLWDVFSEGWSDMYLQAKRYYEFHGDLNVPRDYVAQNGKRLDSWLGKMRRERSMLNNEQIGLLRNIGF